MNKRVCKNYKFYIIQIKIQFVVNNQSNSLKHVSVTRKTDYKFNH